MIDDRTVVVLAVSAGTAAACADRLPGWAPAAMAVLGGSALWTGVGGRRARGSGVARPSMVRASAVQAVGLVALVGAATAWRADVDLAGLQRPRPEVIEGVAELGGDPEPTPYGTRVEVVVAGRRWSAVVPREREWAIDGLRMGERVRLRATTAPLSGAPRGWVRSRHLSGRLQVLRIEPAGGTPVWFAAANAVLERLRRGADSFSEPHRRLYLGMVVGDDRGQSRLTRHRFRVAGLAHLLAVSGQNVAFLLAVLAPLARNSERRLRLAVGLAAVAGFVVLTRAEPSVLRAATMAGLGLWASAAGRRAPGVRVVGLATVALLLADPMLVHSVGFQLSLAATVGLVLLARPLQRWLPGPEWLRLPLSVTLAAQAGALPVMAARFGTTSVVAVPANLLAEPAAGLVMMAGLTSGLAAGVVRREPAAVLQWPTRALVWWVDAVARVASQLSVPPLALWGWGILAAAGGLAVLSHRRGATGGTVALPVIALVVLCRPPGPLPGGLRLTPDAVVVDRCGARVVLLAGGGSTDGVVEALAGRGIGRVDALVGRGGDVPTEVAEQLRARVLARIPRCDRAEASPTGTGGALSRGPPARRAGGTSRPASARSWGSTEVSMRALWWRDARRAAGA